MQQIRCGLQHNPDNIFKPRAQFKAKLPLTLTVQSKKTCQQKIELHES